MRYSLVEGCGEDVFAVGRELDKRHRRVVVVCGEQREMEEFNIIELQPLGIHSSTRCEVNDYNHIH